MPLQNEMEAVSSVQVGLGLGMALEATMLRAWRNGALTQFISFSLS